MRELVDAETHRMVLDGRPDAKAKEKDKVRRGKEGDMGCVRQCVYSNQEKSAPIGLSCKNKRYED